MDLCIQTDYLWKIKETILQDSHWLPTNENDIGFRLFLEKSIVCEQLLTPRSLARTIYFIHIIRKNIKHQVKEKAIMILMAQPWGKVMQVYASSFGIQLLYIRHWYPVKGFKFSWRTLLKEWVLQTLKIYFPQGLYWLRAAIFFFQKKPLTNQNNSPKIAVGPQNQWHFENDGFNSEIFLNLQSALPNRSLVFPLSKISAKLHSELTKRKISSCLINRVPPSNIPTAYFLGTTNFTQSHSIDLSGLPSLEKIQLRYFEGEYNYQKSYWMEFFRKQNIKVFTTWRKNGPEHIPVGDALKELGGIMTVWQRSYEEIPSVELSLYTDIAFGFSSGLARIEKLQGSKINYYVATGYIRDYNRELLKPKSNILRKQLQSQGAKKIVSVFDENSLNDSRWHIGHGQARVHYLFWTEKVLQEPWLAVIFKPKRPSSLRQRLGNVNSLVEKAEKTGRLIILDEGLSDISAVPPILGAMASDIAIQACFLAGTTALECALAGVPSLAVDYEGWKRSFRYQLGEGKVVFPNHENLWDVLLEHWNSKEGVPGLGDWSTIIDQLDPFRDGRAAERMGTYLHWLIQGFEQGLDRDTIMADAAERYCKQWGADKISTVN